jgi:ArsR family transcriptional regulator
MIFDTRPPAMTAKYTVSARLFKAMGDENRMMILESLRSGEKCACLLLDRLDIAQSTLSHHMKILCESGLVDSRDEGKWTHYSLSESGCGRAMAILNELAVSAAERAREES